MGLLPDAGIWLKFVEDVHADYQDGGMGPAMHKFLGSLVGLSDFLAAPPARGEGASMHDFEFFMSDEYYPASTFVPDLDRLAASGRPIVTAAGHDSADAYYARTARVIAERLGCRYVEYPGHHLAFQTDPGPFAGQLRAVLHNEQESQSCR
jgi:hypothetical protein